MCGLAFALQLLALLSLLSRVQGDCGPPPEIKNAFPYNGNNRESFAPGESVTYRCLDGFYNRYGNLDVTTCRHDSQWTDLEAFCEGTCRRPPKSSFAKVNRRHLRQMYYPAGSRISYYCHQGYDIIPGVDPIITCIENYTWTAIPLFCKGKSCGDPGKPEHGQTVILTNVLYMARINFTCDDGYKLIGSPSSECVLKENEVEWSNKLPECQWPTENSTTQRPTPEPDSGNSIAIAVGDCGPPPHVPFASLRTGTAKESYVDGTRLTYRCNPGYELIPGKVPVLECLGSKWSDENPQFCQGKQCPIPVIDNGDITAPTGLHLGSEITYTCNHGFRVIGANKARCMLNVDNTVGWSRPPPHCQRVICYPPPMVENGRHSGEGKPDDFVFGDSVTYTCNKDYSLIGTATLSCVVAENGLEGAWSPNAPECKVVSCDRPTINNGRLTTTFQPSYTYDHTIGFECNHGYTLVGSQTSKCGADNNWHPPVPTCVKGIVTTHAPPATTKSPTVTTKAPTDRPERGPTENSTTQHPTPEPDSGNSIAIAVGKLSLVLSLLGLIV